ncbi:hypothetical protein ACNOYE_00015 [Nannocystaceae bacterium ST9]
MPPRLTALTLGLLAAACGDPLVGGDYPGVPLLELDGSIRFLSIEEVQDARGQLRVGLFWLTDQSQVAPGEGTSEIADQVVTISGLPGSYVLRVYVPPPPSVLRELPGVEGELAIAGLLLYVDVDEDQAWSPGVDWLVGGSRDALLIWVEDSLNVGDTEFERGYHALGISRSPDTGLTECGMPIAGVTSISSTDPEVQLVIGLLHDVIIDLDCDLRAEEYDICPPPPHIVELCANEAMLERCQPWAHCD